MKERPIIFRPEMVSAIIAGRKTQTRRIVKPQPTSTSDGQPYWDVGGLRLSEWATKPILCPFGVPGDRLWVRERHNFVCVERGGKDKSFVVFQDGAQKYNDGAYYPPLDSYAPGALESLVMRSPLFMPRWASRLTLEITYVRFLLLHEITDEDAIAEGVAQPGEQTWYDGKAREMFSRGWDSIHGPGAWDRNEWVWAITFRKVEA